MKSMKFFAAAIMMAQFALPAEAQSAAPDSTGSQVQEIVYEEIKIPRYKESSSRPAIFYVNDEWIPTPLGILDNLKPEEIIGISIKQDQYNNRAAFMTVSDKTLKRIKDKVKEIDMSTYPDTEPTWMFPGGNWRLHYWLKDNVQLPKDYKGHTRARVGFRVSLCGLISDAKIIESSGNEELDKEALRVVNSMPSFIIEGYRPDTPPSYAFYLSLPIDFTSPDVIYIR